MANISVSLPSDGETVDVADYNTPINTIVNEINGGLDNSNITAAAAIAGSKLADGSVTPEKRSGGFAAGTLDVTSTGAKSITGLSFAPKFLVLKGAATSVTTQAISATGNFDGTNLQCFTTTSSGTFGASRNYDDRFSMVFDSSGISTYADVRTFVLTSDGFTYSCVTANAGATMAYEAYA